MFELLRKRFEKIYRGSHHYENFPVAPFYFSKKKIKALSAIYKFARYSDDIADSTEFSKSVKLNELIRLKKCLLKKDKPKNNFEKEIFHNLFFEIKNWNLNLINFSNLIDAFISDQQKNEYENIEEILIYCKNSANPIGRIVLELFNENNEKNMQLSDSVCSGLQILNFIQDIENDIKIGRFYMPKNILRKYDCEFINLTNKSLKNEKFIEEILTICESYLQKGFKLQNELKGSLKIYMKFVTTASLRCCEKLKQNDNFFKKNRKLTFYDYSIIFFRVILT